MARAGGYNKEEMLLGAIYYGLQYTMRVAFYTKIYVFQKKSSNFAVANNSQLSTMKAILINGSPRKNKNTAQKQAN